GVPRPGPGGLRRHDRRPRRRTARGRGPRGGALVPGLRQQVPHPLREGGRLAMTMTRTRAASQTATHTQIVYVARKVEADLLAIIDTYGYESEQWALDVMHDVRVLLDEEVIDRIYLAWTRRGSNEVIDAYSYKVIVGGIGLADDRSGNIRYRP